MKKEELVTIKVTKPTQRILRKMRGYNGCVTFEDVIKYLLRNKK